MTRKSTPVIKLSDLRKATYACDCGRQFPCLLGLSAHALGKHRRNILACPSHGKHAKPRERGAKMRFTVRSATKTKRISRTTKTETRTPSTETPPAS